MTTQSGTVKWYQHEPKGYGFIEPDGGGPDVFVHISAVSDAKIDGLREGDRIEFEIVAGRGGRSQAGKLRRI